MDKRLEDEIRAMLASRSTTICPSEVARKLGGEEWRSLMQPTRQAARRLVAQGELEITQRGQVVDPSFAKGPIRLRAARHHRG